MFNFKNLLGIYSTLITIHVYNFIFREKYLKQIADGRHFTERDGEDFLELIDEEYIIMVSKTRNCFIFIFFLLHSLINLV